MRLQSIASERRTRVFRRPSRYNFCVSAAVFEDMKRYVRFGQQDVENLRALADPVRPHLDSVVDRFYEVILSHGGARQVLSGGERQVSSLRRHLRAWLETLFCGRYDEAYVQRRAVIGHKHVQAGLPQHYMFTAMEVVREEFERIVRSIGVPEPEQKLRSLSKLLALETGLMLESYKLSYSERIRRSERVAVQERLSRAEHLAEIGQLAASLAHEIKNPLAGISGAIQVMRAETREDDLRRPILDEILHQINRLDGTVKDLLVYARPKAPQRRACRLSSVIARVQGLLANEATFRHVRLEVADCDGLPPLQADEHQIEQLLVNLLLNAAQASKPGQVVQLHAASDGHEVTLVVRDYGVGIPREVLARAFEPFFTTKSRGTGLGLPICQRIVDMHGGSITLDSTPGEGTVVTVRLPLDGREAGEDEQA